MSRWLRRLLYVQAGALLTPFAAGLVVLVASIASRTQQPCQAENGCPDVGVMLLVLSLFL